MVGTPVINFSFYDVDNNLLGDTDNLYIFFETTSTVAHHYEMKHIGGKVYIYKDGATPPTDTGVTFTDDIYYFKIYTKAGSGIPAPDLDFFFDDFSTQGDVVGSIAHDWYIRRDINNEALSGLYDQSNTLIDANDMHTSYTYKIIAGEPANSIKMYYLSGNKTYFDTHNIYTEHYGAYTYNFTDLLMNANYMDDLFGIYSLEMYRDDEMLTHDTFYYTYITAGIFTGTVNFNKDLYAVGELAQVSTTLTDEDFTLYDFSVNITSIGGIVSSHSVIEDPHSYTWDTAGLSTDYYYAQLIATNKTSGFSFVLDWDMCKVTEKTTVTGTAYNAYNGTGLGNVSIKYFQNSYIYDDMSDASGDYDVGEMETSVLTIINASKAAYLHNNFSATFLAPGAQDVDLWLLPDASTLPHSGTTIAGLAQIYPFHQPVLNATVNIWNSSWSNSTTTTSSGFYYFENLVNGTYWMNASAGWHETTDDEQVVTNDGTVKYQYFLLSNYSLLVESIFLSYQLFLFS